MKAIPKLALLLFFVLTYLAGWAQPSMDCVSTNENTGDVVINFTPDLANPCPAGTFLNYSIYGATDSVNGPYLLIGTITNQNITTFTHTGANATILDWYYYVVQNCTGGSSAHSDTLGEKILDIPRFTFVTVINDSTVQVNWRPTTSSAVDSIVILYRDPSTGLSLSIDTVDASVHSILDTINRPGASSITYTIKALDACNTPSIENDSVHNTLFLDVQSNSCLQKATIGWNRYINWANDTVKEYLLQTTIDNNSPSNTSLGNPFPSGAPASLRESYDFSIAGLVGDTITFKVIAINLDGVTQSASNVVKLPLNVLRSTGFNYCSNATVSDTNVMSISWIIDTTAQVSNFNIKRSQDGQNFQTIDTVFLTANNVFEPSYLDSTAVTSSGSYYYEIESQDICGFTLESTIAHTIFLTGTSVSGAVNHLSWNPFELTHATVLNYVVYRLKADGTASPLVTLLPDVTSYDDLVGDAVSNDGVFCYRIVSTYVLNLPDLSISKSYVTQSNDICIGKDPVIYIPNAFVPDGINRFFKPVLLFGVSQYDFKIFDRWGKQLFASQDPVAGWDGIYNGEKLPLGGYIYQLKVVGSNGQSYERQGVVTLVR